MNIWYLEKWKRDSVLNSGTLKKGLRLRIDREVDPAVREFCVIFAKWLRTEFQFPLRVNVYLKSDYRIRAQDGEMVVGTFWRPLDYNSYPYIRLATGDYSELVAERGEENAKWAILSSFVHELTHYYQYVNHLKLSLVGEERQANAYINPILLLYCHNTGDGLREP